MSRTTNTPIQIVHARTLRVLASNLRAVLVEITSCVGISSFCARLSISWSRFLACSTSGTPIVFSLIFIHPFSRSHYVDSESRRTASSRVEQLSTAHDGDIKGWRDRKIVSYKAFLVVMIRSRFSAKFISYSDFSYSEDCYYFWNIIINMCSEVYLWHSFTHPRSLS